MSRTVLITGASSGLGRATAERFHDAGWNVIATMRSPEREISFTMMDRMLVARLDVEDRGSIDEAVGDGIQMFGRIDVLINNAGYCVHGPLEATSMDKVRRQLEVNFFGAVEAIRAVLPYYRQNRAGTIINVSSIRGRMAFPLASLYHASKFALEGLSEALQYELGEIGISVKLIEPGGIKTDFSGRSLDVNDDPSLEEYQPFVRSAWGALRAMFETQMSPPDIIAEIVYGAAIDGSHRLRYAAGPDAVHLLQAQRSTDDAPFFAHVLSQFKLRAG